jgi:hypothetical protein
MTELVDLVFYIYGDPARLIKSPGGGQNQVHGAEDGLSMMFHARPGVMVETITEGAGGEELGCGGARGRAKAGDVLPGGIAVGRRFRTALEGDDNQVYGQKLAEIVL